MTERQIDRWGGEDDEVIRHVSQDDAIEAMLDDMAPGPLPATITVCGFAFMVVDPAKLNILDDVLENLDCNFRDHEGAEPFYATAAMRRAEIEFVKAVLADYEPSNLDLVSRVEVDVREWVERHRPDWIANGVTFEAVRDES